MVKNLSKNVTIYNPDVTCSKDLKSNQTKGESKILLDSCYFSFALKETVAIGSSNKTAIHNEISDGSIPDGVIISVVVFFVLLACCGCVCGSSNDSNHHHHHDASHHIAHHHHTTHGHNTFSSGFSGTSYTAPTVSTGSGFAGTSFR